MMLIEVVHFIFVFVFFFQAEDGIRDHCVTGVQTCALPILNRHNRRIWMLWTVPVVSFFTCVLVFGFMVVTEGWQGHVVLASVTLLDEVEKRATTMGRTAFYSPLTPGDGLRFSPETEVSPLGRE